MYRELHPEDTDVKTSDIEIHSLESIFINDLYNDLGFIVNEGEESRFVILVEAQCMWTGNLTLRLLLYLAETYRQFLLQRKLTVHIRKRLKIPKPELYVIYTGNENVPDIISFKDDFFDGDCCVDVLVKVLKHQSAETVSGQYIGFSKVYDEQRERETYNKKVYAEGKEEGIEIGKEEGIGIGTIKTLVTLVKKSLISVDLAAEEAKMTVADFMNLPEMKKA